MQQYFASGSTTLLLFSLQLAIKLKKTTLSTGSRLMRLRLRLSSKAKAARVVAKTLSGGSH
jgi:hypothetical protein